MGSTAETQSTPVQVTDDETALFAIQLASASVLPMALKSSRDHGQELFSHVCIWELFSSSDQKPRSSGHAWPYPPSSYGLLRPHLLRTYTSRRRRPALRAWSSLQIFHQERRWCLDSCSLSPESWQGLHGKLVSIYEATPKIVISVPLIYLIMLNI